MQRQAWTRVLCLGSFLLLFLFPSLGPSFLLYLSLLFFSLSPSLSFSHSQAQDSTAAILNSALLVPWGQKGRRGETGCGAREWERRAPWARWIGEGRRQLGRMFSLATYLVLGSPTVSWVGSFLRKGYFMLRRISLSLYFLKTSSSLSTFFTCLSRSRERNKKKSCPTIINRA